MEKYVRYIQDIETGAEYRTGQWKYFNFAKKNYNVKNISQHIY